MKPGVNTHSLYSFLELLQDGPTSPNRTLGKWSRFYRLDALPVIKPKVSKHKMELEALTPNRKIHPLASCLYDPSSDLQLSGEI